ncbi:hypothetical protein A6R68_21359 [Neotoma lepida]|uniref:Uncharacterized protein n=1 Tax=Neotoma lepida TaxID=56216 RepID=A0A1A6HPR6_NEOLE|nr:hypothetical protein A6R68_21359 [Neotoma lepida]
MTSEEGPEMWESQRKRRQALEWRNGALPRQTDMSRSPEVCAGRGLRTLRICGQEAGLTLNSSSGTHACEPWGGGRARSCGEPAQAECRPAAARGSCER